MTRDEIIQKVAELSARRVDHRRDDQKLRHFLGRIESVADGIVFDALISFFVSASDTETRFDEQECAGTLLALRRPIPTVKMEEVIPKVAACWDVSVEQLPWYFALVYGRESFRDSVAQILGSDDHDDRSTYALKTLLYWTGMSEDRIREELGLIKKT